MERYVVVRVGGLWGHQLIGPDGNAIGGPVGFEGYSRDQVEDLCARLNAAHRGMEVELAEVRARLEQLCQ